LASSRVRSSDIKLIVGATVGVLLAGFLIAAGALVATRGSKSVVCGRVNIGSAADIRKSLDDGGPSFLTPGGANCGFWLALSNGDIVAYRVKQPSGCSLNLRDRATRWVCGNEDVDPVTLATFDVSIQKFGTVDAVIVDMVAPGSASSTSSTAAAT
jgi:hypothetical protein